MIVLGVVLVLVAVALVIFGVVAAAVKWLVIVGVILLVGGIALALVGRRRLR